MSFIQAQYREARLLPSYLLVASLISSWQTELSSGYLVARRREYLSNSGYDLSVLFPDAR